MGYEQSEHQSKKRSTEECEWRPTEVKLGGVCEPEKRGWDFTLRFKEAMEGQQCSGLICG